MEKRHRGRREACGDSTTSHSMKVLLFGSVGKAEKKKPSGRSISEKGPKKSFIQRGQREK